VRGGVGDGGGWVRWGCRDEKGGGRGGRERRGKERGEGKKGVGEGSSWWRGRSIGMPSERRLQVAFTSGATRHFGGGTAGGQGFKKRSSPVRERRTDELGLSAHAKAKRKAGGCFRVGGV